MYLIVKFGSLIGAPVHWLWAGYFLYLDLPFLMIWNIVSGVVFTAIFLNIHRPAAMQPSIYVAVIEIPAHAVLATLYLGIESSFWLFAITPAMLCFGIDFWPRITRALVGATITIILVATLGYVSSAGPLTQITVAWIAFFAITNALAAIGQLVLTFGLFEQAVERTEARLKHEYDRAEGLLKNILPDAIALRLKNGEHLIADDHPDVSVIFADIVNFTEASANLRPAELVETLNMVFTEFDLLAERYRAEKIKTIGDAYMAVVGVPGARANHAQVSVDLALEMLAAARRISATTHFPIDLRIGINSGPVVAGVIGKNKFAFDLWGDAVNVAARMESHAAPGKIMITQATRCLLNELYQTRDEGVQDIKGKGPTQVWSMEPAAFEGGAP